MFPGIDLKRRCRISDRQDLFQVLRQESGDGPGRLVLIHVPTFVRYQPVAAVANQDIDPVAECESNRARTQQAGRDRGVAQLRIIGNGNAG
jgi:hypothetical protein